MTYAKLLALLISLALLFLAFYGFPVVVQIYKNAALTSTTKALDVHWSAKALNEEDWKPVAQFKYVVDGKEYSKEELFQGYKYRNSYAAEADFPYLSERYQTVWYAPRNPERATLEKFFPTKRSIYVGVLFAILFYFVWGSHLYITHLLKKSK